ncbi:uncharacterized protein LOC127101923 [Lathyrus oleraceus]|uniref:uncharacterized protein LOC127101923 n=1 Tax=Pisum sativum TaxID=3888 RepID=UPI0021D37B6B|nr:uncharacterized protein LOC127101923 [Pisum sativum]
MRQPPPNVAMNFDGPNFNDPHANGYHARNQGLHGNFPPPPPPLDISAHANDKKYRMLEERLKSVEGQGVLWMDITDPGLVPGVRVPPKFKVPVLDKYTGTTCPKTHVRAYYCKMSAYFEDERLLMHFFQDNLAGASLEWYMHLERTYIRNWRDLVEEFVKHYQYNIDMAPNRTQLQSLTQGPNESFKEYAQKWRELAARVQHPLMEREMVDMFMGTLQGPYYDRMMGSTSIGFSELVMAGERIEAGLEMGKIQSANTGSSASGVTKKSFNGNPKKKEGESSAAYTQRGKGRQQYKPQHQQHYQHQHHHPHHQQQVNVMVIPIIATPQQQHP